VKARVVEPLPVDRQRLVQVVVEDRGIAVKAALRVLDLDLADISRREGCDLGDESLLVESPSFFIEVDRIAGVIRIPRPLIADRDRVPELLRAADGALRA